ncbi:MAG: tyrosine-type recombinase/integrase [Oxalobacter sp.]
MTYLPVCSWELSLFPRFLTESDFKPKTQATFRAALRAFVAWCTAHQVTEPDTASINRYKSFLLSRYQTATARTYLSVLKVFFRWMSGTGLGNDVSVPVKSIRTDKGFRKDCLSGVDMKHLLAYLKDRLDEGGELALRDFVMVLLVVCCGLRVSEVSLLDVGDLDSVAGEPVVWVQGKGRDGKVDFVPVTPSVKHLLFQYLESRCQPLSRNSPVFVSYGRNSYGCRLSAKSISRIIKQAMVSVGFDSPRLTAHSLRHTAVTLALQGGATLQQVQQFARHRLIETTLHYAHNLEYARNPCPKLVMDLIGRIECLGIPIASRPARRCWHCLSF